MRYRHCLAALLASVLLFGAAAAGQPDGYTFNSDSAMLLLMPELGTAPAPNWLKPGMRLVYYGAAARVTQGEISKLIEDPNGPFIDPNTGKRYKLRMTRPGQAGGGYTVLDVISVHHDVAAVQMTVYGLDGIGNQVHVLSTGAITTPPGYCSDWWVNPDVLAHHLDINGPAVHSALLPYELNGVQHKSFYLSTKISGGAAFRFWDRATGQLLHSGIASTSAGKHVTINGEDYVVGQRSDFSLTTLREARQLHIPWAEGPLPASLAHLRKLYFAGARTTLVPGSPPLPIPFSGQIVVTGRGPDFLQARRTTVVNMPYGMTQTSPPVNLVTGCNQLEPLAIPPDQLALLHVGQVLDSDPVTQLVTTVRYIGLNAAGRDVVVLSQSQGPGTLRIDTFYDRTTGLLAGVNSTDPVARTQVQLTITGQE